MQNNEIEKYIEIAQGEAARAVDSGNAPFGAVAIDKTGLIVKAHNTVNSTLDPTAHAEINLLRKLARKSKKVKFNNIAVIINAEPCSMCASALIRSGIREIYYGAPQEKKQILYIPVSDIAKKSTNKLIVKSGFLEADCSRQIKKSRQKNIKKNFYNA